VLFDAGLFQGSYYLAGYSVECALKAAIAKATRAEDFPDKPTVEKSWTHNLEELLGTAGLRQTLKSDASLRKPLGDNWAVVVRWNEANRYKISIEEKQTRDLLAAISDSPDGVMEWLRLRW
jgi:hypothetical protein